MDRTVLSLTPEQHEKYLKIASSDTVDLNFDVPSANIQPLDTDFEAQKFKMTSGCERVLSFSNNNSFFQKDPTKEEIKDLIPVFYAAINDIEASRAELYKIAIAISQKIVEADTSLAHLHSQYTEFLPYKAALYEREGFRGEVMRLDAEFLAAIENLTQIRAHYVARLEALSNISDRIIPEFFSAATKYADAPKFKDFKDKEFFAQIRGFIEKIKAI